MGTAFFERKVDRRCRKAMAEYLAGHHRYSTMNSWNGMTSYANCVKVTRLGLTRAQLDKAFEILETDFWVEIEWPIQDFTFEMKGWTIGTNGRSDGYLVLYRASIEETGHKSFCPQCGQRNFRAVTAEYSTCGVCGGKRVDFDTPPKTLNVLARSVDQDEDFADWSMEDLRARVDLIRRFDRACDEVRAAFIDLCERAQVVEETVSVPKKQKVLVLPD
jgi:ribosomal protein S27AE